MQPMNDLPTSEIVAHFNIMERAFVRALQCLCQKWVGTVFLVVLSLYILGRFLRNLSQDNTIRVFHHTKRGEHGI